MCSIHELFSLSEDSCRVHSPRTITYNALAWAANENLRVWDPVQLGGYYWPKGIPRECTLATFVMIFTCMGYAVVADIEYPQSESNFENIAIYVDSINRPTHVARQLSNGLWTSKLPDREDILHNEPTCLEGSHFGYVALLMQRLVSS